MNSETSRFEERLTSAEPGKHFRPSPERRKPTFTKVARQSSASLFGPPPGYAAPLSPVGDFICRPVSRRATTSISAAVKPSVGEGRRAGGPRSHL
jgi:hypothetical protein